MARESVLLIFPHQLFLEHPGLDRCDAALLVEDGLFFGDHRLQAAMHRQKLWLHRASMKRYEQQLIDRGIDVRYLDHEDGVDMVDVAMSTAAGADRTIVVGDPHDYLLERRLRRAAKRHGLDLEFARTPMFINTAQQNRDYREGKKRWFMADFYKHQRRRLDVKPGITGWAQVHGRNTVGWPERFEMDVWYVENRGMLLDLRILVLTLVQVFRVSEVSQAGHATQERFTGNDE